MWSLEYGINARFEGGVITERHGGLKRYIRSVLPKKYSYSVTDAHDGLVDICIFNPSGEMMISALFDPEEVKQQHFQIDGYRLLVDDLIKKIKVVGDAK